MIGITSDVFRVTECHGILPIDRMHGVSRNCAYFVTCGVLQDLKEQVRDLMVYVEASQMAGKSEIAGGDVQVGPSAKPTRRSRR